MKNLNWSKMPNSYATCGEILFTPNQTLIFYIIFLLQHSLTPIQTLFLICPRLLSYSLPLSNRLSGDWSKGGGYGGLFHSLPGSSHSASLMPL